MAWPEVVFRRPEPDMASFNAGSYVRPHANAVRHKMAALSTTSKLEPRAQVSGGDEAASRVDAILELGAGIKACNSVCKTELVPTRQQTYVTHASY
jgi:hypothetical protein